MHTVLVHLVRDERASGDDELAHALEHRLQLGECILHTRAMSVMEQGDVPVCNIRQATRSDARSLDENSESCAQEAEKRCKHTRKKANAFWIKRWHVNLRVAVISGARLV